MTLPRQKVARDMVRTFKMEFPSQTTASLMLAHMIKTVPEEKSENQVRVKDALPLPEMTISMFVPAEEEGDISMEMLEVQSHERGNTN